jgi:hypothetical protein
LARRATVAVIQQRLADFIHAGIGLYENQELYSWFLQHAKK